MSLLFYIGLVLIVVFYLSGAPLAVVFALGGMVMALGVEPSGQLIAVTLSGTLDSYVMIAAVYIILAGQLIVCCGGMQALHGLASSGLRGYPRISAAINAFLSVILGAFGGPGNTWAELSGKGLIPALNRSGLRPSASSGLAMTASGAGLFGIPSVLLIVYGVVAEISIARLILGGIVPFFLMAFVLGLTGLIFSKPGPPPTEVDVQTSSEPPPGFLSLAMAIPPFLFLIVYVMPIAAGWFTPGESAAVTVVYSLFFAVLWLLIGLAVKRVVNIGSLGDAFHHSLGLIIQVYLFMFGAMLFHRILHMSGVVISLTDGLSGLSPAAVLMVAYLSLMVMGFLLGSLPGMVIGLPVLFPAIVGAGLNPAHFGITAILALVIGECLPPFGPRFQAFRKTTAEPAGALFTSSLPYLAAMVLILIIITVLPGLVLFLPGAVF